MDAAPTSRLDASPTPRLDAQRPSPTSAAAPKRETFAEADARTRREKTLSGAFGEQAQKREEQAPERAENLGNRKGLFAEMQDAQKRGEDIGGLDTNFQERATELGVSDEQFSGAMGRIDSRYAAKPATPAPLTGRALAEKNIATKGQAGAAADYFKRAEAEKAALEKRSPLNTVSSRFTEKAGTPAPESRKTFGQMFGYAMDRNEPSPAMIAARANALAAKEKATSMREEYEAGKVKEGFKKYASEQVDLQSNIEDTLLDKGLPYDEAHLKATSMMWRRDLMQQARGQADPRLTAKFPSVIKRDRKESLRLAKDLKAGTPEAVDRLRERYGLPEGYGSAPKPKAPPTPPTSVFQGLREDAATVNKTIGNVATAGKLAVAIGAQKTLEGAGELYQKGEGALAAARLAGADVVAKGYRTAKRFIPGRTGEAIRNKY